MFFDDFVLSDRHARQRQQETLREVEHIRLANQVASASPSQQRRAVQPWLIVLMVMLQR